MDLRVGDGVELKKAHPCGEQAFVVLRVGMDIKLKCRRCGREVMTPRGHIERYIKKVIRTEEEGPG